MGALGKQDNRESELIDAEMLQRFQERFCSANGMYLVCMGADHGVITQAYGSEEEKAFLHELFSERDYWSLIQKLQCTTVENMVEEELEHDYLKLSGISIPVGGKTQIIWIVAAILEERLEEDAAIPEYMQTTTEVRFYHSAEFLEYMSRFMLAVKMDELIAQEAMQKSVASEESMERQLRRSETMTQIVTMLESENGFGKIVDDILKMVCESLDISCGALIRESADDGSLDMICEYTGQEEWRQISSFQKMAKEEVPFFNGKPYMISSDTMRPEAFSKFFEKYHITAAVYQPVEVNERALMYLCFYEIGRERIWDVPDIEFISDVKRIIQSILSKRIAKNSLASSYASLEAILENVGCGIYVLDMERKKILYTNQKFKTLLANNIASGRVKQFLFPEEDREEQDYFEEMYSAEEERWLDVHKTSIHWVDGKKVGLGTIYDVTDRKLYQKKIENQANNDFLTGLYNRMRCEQDLERYIRMTETNGGEGALLYIDLDDFKHINDGLGHQYGDVLLKAISHSLQQISGIESNCYRMGGDEFIVIVTDNNYLQLETICSQIQEIFTKPWFLKGEDYYCTMSMGIVCFPADGNSVEDLIRKADMALFSAKREGKNRVEYYNAKDAVASHRRLDMEKNMRKATRDACNEFEVYFQPIVNTEKDGFPCCGAEALVRWNSTEMGFISPEDFIPLAEYLGLINPIGDYVLYEAAKRCKYWNDMGHPDYKVNVNLSVVQLLQNDIVKKVQKVLEDTRINPKNLTLEVTESLAINDMERMKRILGQIKELGVKVALDDFGTGYSSLNHIREMPIDVIKIDRCFIEHISEDDFSDAFVRMVTELASTIGVKVCVEGVETKKQCDVLGRMQISMIQGYYFGKPMKIVDFEKEYL